MTESRNILERLGIIRKDLPSRTGETLKVGKVSYGVLQKIWTSKYEFGIYRTSRDLTILHGAEGHIDTPQAFSGDAEMSLILKDFHSHPVINNPKIPLNPITGLSDTFSINDWLTRFGPSADEIGVTYPQGAFRFKIDRSKVKDKEMEAWNQGLLERFIDERTREGVYIGNKVELPYKERLPAVAMEFIHRNRRRKYEIAADLMNYAAEQEGIELKRFDLSDPNSKDTTDFLNILNSKPISGNQKV